ncbi:PREDICTED: phenylalanine--tRNA ligase beta subunit, cytoplasmic-like isoform X1 [Tarenaya hassleriana]|uniref:phenylalanine--tRNA ligase beta subunit, cytoplasmic-like isoform X1 n=1 Tax=Tarenaya hassleriana TaxID=28532 RepID=UPI00053C559D|nr:PREDICTED: phenylalanine--tRNA ligase beta subunit, cytoplasmic-like isoform X1 [Tarenaya hassleriana]XP_010529814.1 PREDICTED: phenylalanine--tRNA ligase beta subunit, cytoplasmic-like isoform X1 [Tarenaya hassleriana]XP_010529815.1 PREDICTED: phenylalanine--tRNA ligase beta subunit, cytoplasmic-like isoform X1 [Tarenaya hassleriana]XP_010529817.1 PREDICTED: phenylalanine--tRNA ligase beta subunit, cytoplasmic-like isoform X2 [Tarenaya hassleriana]XP_019057171.1 PREDICTED: phenylalanine--tR
MPTVSVGRDRLFAALGQSYTQEEFEDLCFRFGIELDDVTTEKAIIRKEKHLEEEADDDEETIYKIEVPANRYDLLCLEGLAQALRIFNGKQDIPAYKFANVGKDLMLKMRVQPETSQIRSFVVCAVLRGLTFDEARYNSFIDLQDKLHQNICRRRTLVAIGTHDLDTLQGPFTYEALPPAEINFVPLKQTKSFRADELMEFYKSDLKLKKYLHIIENSPVFPVLYDSKRTVLSLPPIINGAHSAITLQTKNVFIECTATDLTKAKIVLNTMVTAFSGYCETKFEIEPVEVIYDDGKSQIYPDLSVYDMEVPLSYITDLIGVSLEAEEVTSLLNRMQLRAELSKSSDSRNTINVHVPPTRSDVLHPCDVMEDVAIAYGYNNIPRRKPTSINPLPLNEISDLIRAEIAMNGYTEVLMWILCSHKENFAMLNRKDDGSAVIIGNPRSADFEVVRTSLMPGILKTVGINKDHPKPIKIFEVGDIALLDEKKDVGASNRRRLAALHCGATSGFELIHCLVDRIMEVMATPFVPVGDNTGYYIKRSQEPEYLPGRQASIVFKGKHIGNFGIVHPEVLTNFDISDPCSFVEIDIESLLLP